MVMKDGGSSNEKSHFFCFSLASHPSSISLSPPHTSPPPRNQSLLVGAFLISFTLHFVLLIFIDTLHNPSLFSFVPFFPSLTNNLFIYTLLSTRGNCTNTFSMSSPSAKRPVAGSVAPSVLAKNPMSKVTSAGIPGGKLNAT